MWVLWCPVVSKHGVEADQSKIEKIKHEKSLLKYYDN